MLLELGLVHSFSVRELAEGADIYRVYVTRSAAKAVATRKIDHIYEAFNDQDLDRLTEEFEGMTYESPSGVEFEGADAAEHWEDAFGVTVTRTTGVFAIGDGGARFVTVYREPSGLSTAYAVEIEISGVHVTSMTEGQHSPDQ